MAENKTIGAIILTVIAMLILLAFGSSIEEGAQNSTFLGDNTTDSGLGTWGTIVVTLYYVIAVALPAAVVVKLLK